MFKVLCIVLLAAAAAYALGGGHGLGYPLFGYGGDHSYAPYISYGHGMFGGYNGYGAFGGRGGYTGPGVYTGFGFGGNKGYY